MFRPRLRVPRPTRDDPHRCRQTPCCSSSPRNGTSTVASKLAGCPLTRTLSDIQWRSFSSSSDRRTRLLFPVLGTRGLLLPKGKRSSFAGSYGLKCSKCVGEDRSRPSSARGRVSSSTESVECYGNGEL